MERIILSKSSNCVASKYPNALQYSKPHSFANVVWCFIQNDKKCLLQISRHNHLKQCYSVSCRESAFKNAFVRMFLPVIRYTANYAINVLQCLTYRACAPVFHPKKSFDMHKPISFEVWATQNTVWTKRGFILNMGPVCVLKSCETFNHFPKNSRVHTGVDCL